MGWLPLQPPAWNAPATDLEETQQPAPSAESSALAREFSLDSKQVPWSWQSLQPGNGTLLKGLGVGGSHISGWAGFISVSWRKRWAFLLSSGGLSKLGKASAPYSCPITSQKGRSQEALSLTLDSHRCIHRDGAWPQHGPTWHLTESFTGSV